MKMESSFSKVIVVFVLIFVLCSIIYSSCIAAAKCHEQAEQYLCIPGTITYDYGDGECECMSTYGEVDWGAQGCGMN